MKLRQKLEDFKVEEINDFKILKDGKFKLYLLEKRGLESFSLIKYLTKHNRVPIRAFGIAGLKDRQAITKQYFTIPSKFEIRTLKEKNFDIKFLGFVEKELRLGNLACNKFNIIVRNLKKKELDEVYKQEKEIKEIGVPNYFDSQRFGSVIARKFIAKFVILGNYEEAVKIHLTHYNKHEKKEIKDEKKNLFKNWSKLEKLKIKNSTLSYVIDTYKKTKKWSEAYRVIPAYLRSMYLSAYQSYLWNECVKEIFRRKLKDLYTIEYKVGDLLFFNKLGVISQEFPLINYNTRFSGFEKEIVNKILLKEGVKIKDFNLKNERFPIGVRKLVVKPKGLKLSSPRRDELSKNNFKLNLSFSLQKGSYATMIIKKLFA